MNRVVKKMRRLEIRDAAGANALLTSSYLADHNRRFATAPASAEDFHRRTPSRTALDRIFQLEETRVLSNDWVVRYDNPWLQVARQSRYAPAGSQVVVREAPSRARVALSRAADDVDRAAGPAGQSRAPAHAATGGSGHSAEAPPQRRSRLASRHARDRSSPNAGPSGDAMTGRRPMDAAGAVDAQNAPTRPYLRDGVISLR